MSINEYKPHFEKTIEHLKEELSSLRTNRVTPSLVEHVRVSAYEGSDPMQLKQLASISSPEPRQLLVEPWDKSALQAIEKSLQTNDVGFSVANEGSCIRLTMPLMTEEVRAKILKVLGVKIEDARIAIRGVRDNAKEEIQKQEKNKQITEDDRYRLIELLDEMTKEYTEKVRELAEQKEKEIKG